MRTIKGLGVIAVAVVALACTRPVLTPHTTPRQSLAELCYSEGSGTWHDLPSLPTDEARGYTSAVKLDNWVYLIGGVTTTDNPATPEDDHLKFPFPRAAVYRYDLNAGLGGDWAEATKVPVPVAGASVVAFDKKIYVVGGYTGEEDTYHKVNLLQIYDPASNTWTSGPPMNEVRAWAAGVVVGDKLCTIGGVSKGYYTDTVECLDLVDDKAAWQIVGKVLAPRYGLGAVEYQGKILVVGGDSWLKEPKPGENPDPQSDLIELVDLGTGKSTRVGILDPATSAIVGVQGTDLFYIQGELWRAVSDGSDQIKLVEVTKIPASEQESDQVYHGFTGLGVVATVNGILIVGGGGSGAPSRNVKAFCN